MPLFPPDRKEQHVDGRSTDPPGNGVNVHGLAGIQNTIISIFHDFYKILAESQQMNVSGCHLLDDSFSLHNKMTTIPVHKVYKVIY